MTMYIVHCAADIPACHDVITVNHGTTQTQTRTDTVTVTARVRISSHQPLSLQYVLRYTGRCTVTFDTASG